MNKNQFTKELSDFETFLKSALNEWAAPPSPLLHNFWEGLNYSLFGGGKRFRPLLCLLTARALKTPESEVFGVASAVEMIHTYSLIHDDLPSLDNDDIRRGRPTHHKKFGEDMALLAGDGLLTLAFFILAKAYASHPSLGAVVSELSRAVGIQGMVGGQVLDMKWSAAEGSEDLLKQIHALKTGALIATSVTLSARICKATEEQIQNLSQFGEGLGLAFQISDDIQDAREGESQKNFVALWGEEKTLKFLKQISEQAKAHLQNFGPEADPLRELVDYNIQRL